MRSKMDVAGAALAFGLVVPSAPALCLLALGGCDRCSSAANERKPAEHAAPEAAGSAHADEPEHEELPKRVRMSRKVIESAKIRWAPVVRERLDVVLDLPGEIAADPDRMARVSAPAAGRIERVMFQEGRAVKKGDVLAVVRVIDLPERQAAFAGASARAVAARANAERLEALAAKGLAAQQEVAAARAEAAALEAQTQGEKQRLGALGVGTSGKGGSLLEVRAPIGGTVVARDAVVGQPADPEHPIATLVDMSELWFLARVFERDLGGVHVGADAEVQLNARPTDRFAGKVAYVSRQVDPAARTVVARVPLVNRDDLLQIGLFGTARVSVSTGTGEPSLVVPRGAVTDIDEKAVAFVHHPDDDFEVHPLVLGRAAPGKIEVLSGLREGEEVVVEGVFSLKSAVLKSTFGEEE